MKQFITLLFAIFFLPYLLFAGDEKNIVPSSLKSAVVYRSGAELQHTAKANLKQGNNDLIIEGISNSIDINSLQIGTDAHIAIMSVEFSTDYLKPIIKSANIIRLEDSLEVITRELTKIQVLLKTNNELLELLKRNKEIRGSQTGLNVTELVKMMDYYKGKTLELQNEINQYHEKEKKLSEVISRVRLQINEEEQKNTKTTGKIMLQLNSAMAGNYNFTISYVTQTAYWNPYYDLRVENISKPINLATKQSWYNQVASDWKQGLSFHCLPQHLIRMAMRLF
jgi:hypothetical protein